MTLVYIEVVGKTAIAFSVVVEFELSWFTINISLNGYRFLVVVVAFFVRMFVLFNLNRTGQFAVETSNRSKSLNTLNIKIMIHDLGLRHRYEKSVKLSSELSYQNQWYADYSIKGRKTSSIVVNIGCLLYTRANRSVHGLGK